MRTDGAFARLAGRSALGLSTACLFWLSLLSPAPALDAGDRAEIARIEAYLSGLVGFEARFTQTGSDGGRAAGTLRVLRPDRFRFEYDPPATTLLVGTGSRIVHYDGALESTSYIATDDVPAAFLLAEKVDLSGTTRVVDVLGGPGWVGLTLVRRDAPDDGSLTVYFRDGPGGLELRQWEVTDAIGATTRVNLDDIRTGVAFEEGTFRFTPPETRESAP